MEKPKGTLRVCPKGHRYYKSSDCPTCPACEAQRQPAAAFMEGLSAPARRALEREGITTLQKLSSYTEKEILALHGIGPRLCLSSTRPCSTKDSLLSRAKRYQ